MQKWSKYFMTSYNIGMYEEIYENVFIFDAHTHIGIDKDGSKLDPKTLIKAMDNSHVSKAIVFSLNDPLDYRNFTKSNDRVLQACKKYSEKLVPFFRLNPNFNWEKEMERCLSLGFKGIKLHPRSQKFELDSEELLEIYKRAEREKMVILIHLGIGTEESDLAKKLYYITRNFPKLRFILGHGAFVDLDGVIDKIGKSKNIIFEISVMKIFDMFNLISRVDDKKIAFGSDIPYYDISVSLDAVVQTAILLNKSASQIQEMLGKNLLRWFYD